MSTIFDIRSLRLPKLSAKVVVVGGLVVVLAVVAAAAGARLYRKLTTTTVVAYFSEALALYPGDKVQIMGVRVGSIDKIEPAGDKMRVTLHYSNKYQVPATATASILNPSLVASRTIQLSPPYTGGPVLQDGAVIPIERTQVPVEWDQLRDSINGILRQLGPTERQPKGPFGDLIESAADNLAGKGRQLNETLNSLSQALTALNEGRGDFVAITRSLALFVSALYQNDQQFVALNENLAEFTDWFTKSDHDLADTVERIDDVLGTVRKFVSDNRSVLAADVPRRRDHYTSATRAAGRSGNRVARVADLRQQLQQPLLSTAQLSGGPVRVPQLREPNSAHLQRYSGRQPTRLSGIRRAVRAVLGTGSGRSQVQLLAVRLKPVQFGGHFAQGGGLLRGAAPPAARVQGHHCPRDLLAGHTVFTRQP